LARLVFQFHRQGVLHLDLRPEIIIRSSSQDTLHIIDFSRAAGTGGMAEKYTVDFAGDFRSFFYLSPEQAGRINLPVDRRSDIYSLGAVYYHMATGRPPVLGEDYLEWFHALAARDIQPPHSLNPLLPPAVSNIIMKCLAREPGSRYQ